MHYWLEDLLRLVFEIGTKVRPEEVVDDVPARLAGAGNARFLLSNMLACSSILVLPASICCCSSALLYDCQSLEHVVVSDLLSTHLYSRLYRQ